MTGSEVIKLDLKSLLWFLALPLSDPWRRQGSLQYIELGWVAMIFAPQTGSEFCLISATSDMAISVTHIHVLIYSFLLPSPSFLEFHIFLALDMCGV